MAMKQCPICGEKYSDTYQECPFCQEEEALRQGQRIQRSSGHGGKHSAPGGPSWLSPMLVIVIVLLACLLVYLIFGDQIKSSFQKEPVEEPPVEEVLPDEDPEEPDQVEDPDAQPDQDPDAGLMPEDGDPGSEVTPAKPEPEKPTPPKTETAYAAAAALPDGLILEPADFTVKTAGEKNRVKANGGSGKITWISEDPKVAVVDEQGNVTAVGRGTVNVIATDGKKKGVCIVRSNVPAGTDPSKVTPADGSHKLNREDMTLAKGEKFQLKPSGAAEGVVWKTGNAAVATVSGDGTVTGVSAGKTQITATWGGQSVSCIVYVKK